MDTNPMIKQNKNIHIFNMCNKGHDTKIQTIFEEQIGIKRMLSYSGKHI